jgi:hypothetical protein
MSPEDLARLDGASDETRLRGIAKSIVNQKFSESIGRGGMTNTIKQDAEFPDALKAHIASLKETNPTITFTQIKDAVRVFVDNYIVIKNYLPRRTRSRSRSRSRSKGNGAGAGAGAGSRRGGARRRRGRKHTRRVR